MRWSGETVDRTLVGAGWAWLPGQGAGHEAAQLARKLGDHGMQAGVFSETDTADLKEARNYTRVSVDGEALKLHAEDRELVFSKAAPGGASLIGLRWDGKTLWPFAQGAKKPGLVVWSGKGALGTVWLREGADQPGLSKPEMVSLLEQTLARKSLNLLDDSYRPDDVPEPNNRFKQTWAALGGDENDYHALLHGFMIRALHRNGVLSARSDSKFDPEAPISIFAVEKRKSAWRSVDRIVAWLFAVLALAAFRFAPELPLAKIAGGLAGVTALIHSLRIVGRWLRLSARPVAKVRSMAMGPVHVQGEIEAAMMLVSPMRGLRCVYYEQKYERRGRNGWRVVAKNESPHVPFYLKDATGRVLVDTVGADWNGLEKYEHRISVNERVREWVMPVGFHANVYGYASADPDAAVVSAVKEGLGTLFLAGANAFDINRDGVLSDAERDLALKALDQKLKADRSNVSLNGGVHVAASRSEPLVITSHRSFPLGFIKGASALGWAAAGFLFFLGTFVYPEATAAILQAVLSAH
jgi:hypothetical protein